MTPVPWPKVVMVELTNACDLACRHCPFHGDGVAKLRPVQHMTRELWTRALAEVAGWGVALEVQPWAMGEPLLHPDLWQFVRAAKASPHLRVGFYSNGNQWTPADVEAAVDSGLDWVCFSIDGVRPEVFEHYRVGARLSRVLATVRALSTRRQGHALRIRVNMVQYPELEDHGAEFVAAMRGVADSVMVSRFRAVGVRTFSPVQLPRVPCYQLDTLLALASDGRVGQCCEDQQGQQPMGWFPRQSLAEIWHGPEFTRLREAHRCGRYDASPLCRDCDAWTGVYERSRREDGMVVREKTAGTIHEFDAGAGPCAH